MQSKSNHKKHFLSYGFGQLTLLQLMAGLAVLGFVLTWLAGVVFA